MTLVSVCIVIWTTLSLSLADFRGSAAEKFQANRPSGSDASWLPASNYSVRTLPAPSFEKLRYLVEEFAHPTFNDRAYASDTFRFIYVRPVGKIGGSSVQRAYIEPVLCQMFYNFTKFKEIHRRDPEDQACLQYLSRQRIWYSLESRHWDDFSSYFTFAYVRNVCQRAISSYRYLAQKDPRKYSGSFTFSRFLEDIHKICHFQHNKADSSYHWIPQVSGLLNAGVRRIDFIACLNDMDNTFGKVIDVINARRPVDSPALPAPSMRHANRHANRKGGRISIDSLRCGTSTCRKKVCEQSLYKVDCIAVPCGCS